MHDKQAAWLAGKQADSVKLPRLCFAFFLSHFKHFQQHFDFVKLI